MDKKTQELLKEHAQNYITAINTLSQFTEQTRPLNKVKKDSKLFIEKTMAEHNFDKLNVEGHQLQLVTKQSKVKKSKLDYLIILAKYTKDKKMALTIYNDMFGDTGSRLETTRSLKYIDPTKDKKGKREIEDMQRFEKMSFDEISRM